KAVCEIVPSQRQGNSAEDVRKRVHQNGPLSRANGNPSAPMKTVAMTVDNIVASITVFSGRDAGSAQAAAQVATKVAGTSPNDIRSTPNSATLAAIAPKARHATVMTPSRR